MPVVHHVSQPSRSHLREKREELAKQAISSGSSRLLERPFQIILGLHRARSQMLEYFDMSPCRALARFDAAETDAIVVEALPSFLEALKTNSFWLDINHWSPASVSRVMKYVAKGFECAIPGVRRAAFKSDFTTKAGHFYLRKREGIRFQRWQARESLVHANRRPLPLSRGGAWCAIHGRV